MKKFTLLGVILVLVLILLTSCSTGVSQELYNKTSQDLSAAQAQIQSLQGNLTQAQAQYQSLQTEKEGLEQNGAKALAYAEFLDTLMYSTWQEYNIPSRFNFATEVDWLLDLNNRADRMGDTKLSAYLQEMQNGNEDAIANLMDRCFQQIEEALK